MTKLAMINLKGNYLEGIGHDMRNHVDMHVRDHALSIDLSDNILSCGCNNIEFIEWFQQKQSVI